jgi:hypothetical protein
MLRYFHFLRLAPALALLLSPIAARSQCVHDISTGFDQEVDSVLIEGDPDDEYTVDSGFGADPALTGGPGQGFPIPPWFPNDARSLWISSSPNSIAAPILYTYEISFNLPAGIDASELALIGRWSSDNDTPDVLVNGVSTGIQGGGNFTLLTAFPPGAAQGLFQSGRNTIQFLVNNAPPGDNPAGLRVEACAGIPSPVRRPLDISTGFDQANQRLLAGGALDDDYRVTGPPGSGIEGARATVVPADGFPIPPWLQSSINSRWVGLEADDSTGPPGEYVYRIDVPLPAEIDASRAVLRGGFAADDRVLDVLVNGERTGLGAPGFGVLTPFPVDAGRGWFSSGPNRIEFVVANDSEGPTGLRVDGEVAEGPPACELPPVVFAIDTGFDDAIGAVIANALDDDSYCVFGPPGSDIGPVPATVVPDNAFPIGPWFPSSAQSKWIGLSTGSTSGPEGVYTYRVTVHLPEGYDAADARILGRWSSDNGVRDVVINGTSTGISHDGNFTALAAFPPDAGIGLFVNGDNRIDFLVYNAPPNDNPTGLRVEAVVGSGSPDPGVLSTGIGPRGIGALPSGAADRRYLVGGPGLDGPRPAVVMTAQAGWLPSSDLSRWIGLDGGASLGASGLYAYEVELEVGPQQNPARLALAGGWAAAARGVDVELNGISLDLATPGPAALAPFPARSGLGLFRAGRNTLRFLVEGDGGATGLRVEARLEALALPNPLDISTGFDREAGAVLADAEADDDYTVTDPFDITDHAIAIPAGEAPIPPWVANSVNSRWIGLPGASAAAPGLYRFLTEVTLAGEAEAESAFIEGLWATDDQGVDILINGVSTGLANTAGFAAFTVFPPAAGQGLFVPGPNAIEFLVMNGGLGPNPSGLRVDAVVKVAAAKVEGRRFVRGDVNADGSINITDGIAVLGFLFSGGSTPPCLAAADTDDSGGAPTITDAIFLFNWLFLSGRTPPPPSPSTARYLPADCGPDPTEDGTSCESFPPCA